MWTDFQDEFQTSSKELEDELERELAATEKQQTDLREKIKRLEGEKEDWKVSCWPLLRVWKLMIEQTHSPTEIA